MLPWELQVLRVVLVVGFPIGLYAIWKGLRLQRWWWRRRVITGKWFVVAGVFLAGMTIIPFFSILSFSHSVEVSSDYQALDQLVLTTHPGLVEGLRKVEFTEDPLNPEYYIWRLSSDAIGFYTPMTRTIFIPVDGRMTAFSEFNTVWWHELAHHIWYYHMTHDQRNRFVALHEESHAALGKASTEFRFGFPSEYGMTSPEEDFADSFAYFMTARADMRTWVTEEGASRVAVIEEVLLEIADCIEPGCLKVPMSAASE